MSSIAWSLPVAQVARPVAWGRFALVGVGTVAAAVLANLLVYTIGSAVVEYDSRFSPLAGVGTTIVWTLVPAIVATLLYAVLLRQTANPAPIFAGIAAAVVAVAVIAAVTSIPSVPGATVGQTTILVLMQVVGANVIVGLLTACAPEPAPRPVARRPARSGS